MSWYLSHRLVSIHHVVSIALLYSVSSTVLLSPAKAMTLGTTTITSAQHEPLVASITMTDIRSADFVASLANPLVYQQMGLTPTKSMSVSFVPTSATTGQLLINTSQPVSMPFTDIVLAINDNGQRKVIPKTLLMPLSDNVPTKQLARVIAGAQKPNLSVISAGISNRLIVRRGTPPPLLAAPRIQIPLQAQTLAQNNDPDTVTSSILHASRVTTLPPLRKSQISSVTNAIASRAQIPKHTNMLDNNLDDSLDNNIKVQDNSAQTISSTNIHSNILTIQITRQIYTKNEGNKQRPITSDPILKAQMHRVVPKTTYAESIQTSKRLDKPPKTVAKTLKLQNQKPIELVARLNKLRHQ